MANELLQPNIDQAHRAFRAMQNKSLDVVRANMPKAHTERMMKLYDRIVPHLNDTYQNIAVKARPYAAHVAWGMGIQTTLAEIGLLMLGARMAWLAGNHQISGRGKHEAYVPQGDTQPKGEREGSKKDFSPLKVFQKESLGDEVKKAVLAHFMQEVQNAESSERPLYEIIAEMRATMAAEYIGIFLNGLSKEDIEAFREVRSGPDRDMKYAVKVFGQAMLKVSEIVREGSEKIDESDLGNVVISSALGWARAGFPGFTRVTGLPAPTMPKPKKET